MMPAQRIFSADRRLHKWTRPSLVACCCLCVAVASLGSSGCRHAEAEKKDAKPPEVDIESPYQDEVREYQEFTGQTVAVETIEIRARVSGYLEKNFFKDGALVEEGALLFQIDDRPYRAEFERATAALAQARAHLERVKRQEERALQLQEKKAISQESIDQATFDRQEAEATVAASIASRDIAELNLGFTKITAKISGRISRRMVDPGNLVQSDTTPLTSLVSSDPIYAYFDIDERTLLRLRRMMEEEHTDSALSWQVPVMITLADEEAAPLVGKINFLDNQVDASTGTLRARVVIDNPKGMLSPGLFVRLRVPVGVPRQALLVREEALQSNQGKRFVWILNSEDKAIQRDVTIGWQVNGRRVILDGLRPSDRVIVRGVQRVREGKTVAPKPYDDQSDLVSAETKRTATAAPEAPPEPSAGGR